MIAGNSAANELQYIYNVFGTPDLYGGGGLRMHTTYTWQASLRTSAHAHIDVPPPTHTQTLKKQRQEQQTGKALTNIHQKSHLNLSCSSNKSWF